MGVSVGGGAGGVGGDGADATVIVVGGGHNGLICAAYLARTGIDTLLVEARDDVGGCASTVSDLGARFNICNCDHTMIRALPVIEELELTARGLRYLEADASLINLYHDQDRAEPWPAFHEPERQLEALQAAYPDQVEGYRRYLADALPVARLVLDMARTAPSTPRLARRALRHRTGAMARLLRWARLSMDDVLAPYFDDWRLTTPLAATGPTVWGVPPWAPGTGLAALGYATRHLVRTGRPQGGSGALTDAVRASFEGAGGAVRCGARVEGLTVTGGRVDGVTLTDGTRLRAPIVVAACDPQRVFVDWIDEVPPAARRLVDRWRVRPVLDGYESKVDAVTTAVPRLLAEAALTARHPGLDPVAPTMVVAPGPDDLADAHRGRTEGRVAARPTILANVPSVLDPTLRTDDGHHVVSVEVLFTPYALQGGWPGSPEPERWLDLWASFFEPGARDDIDRWRVMTPDRYEREFSMHRGHTPSYSGSPLSALLGRLGRQRELTRYRSPIQGLYLSGAGTFPGAGVFGAAGRNTAAAVARDVLGGRRDRSPIPA